jgi:hypothetical protein
MEANEKEALIRELRAVINSGIDLKKIYPTKKYGN